MGGEGDLVMEWRVRVRMKEIRKNIIMERPMGQVMVENSWDEEAGFASDGVGA